MFSQLLVLDDPEPRAGPLNMAIDEALLQTAHAPVLRFYYWSERSVSFGYFGKVAEAEKFAQGHALVRRWTGGGIVPHGEDLTYSIIIPASDSFFAESLSAIYEKVHGALSDTLGGIGERVELARGSTVIDRRRRVPATADRGYSICFANPVAADVMEGDRKIAGAALRKTRNGFLLQGSIQRASLPERFRECFARGLSLQRTSCLLDAAALQSAQTLAATKYATEAWMRRR